MKKFDEITDRAINNYGIITAAEATAMGVALKDMQEWLHNGRLEKVGRGVFRLRNYPYNEYCHYAEAVALVGDGSWICGDSVLAMHNLALVNPLHTLVATTKRVRRVLPEWIKLVRKANDDEKVDFNGIPCQRIDAVFIEAKGHVILERIHQAIREARGRGLVPLDEDRRIREVFNL